MCEKKQFKYCQSEIDECMKKFIRLIGLHLRAGYRTVGCCCGHGVYPKTLLIEKQGTVIDFFSGEIIPRKRNFYKRDKKGYYYIPETLNLNSKSVQEASR